MSQTKVHFPGLNTLRLIAASAVVIHHIEQIKSIRNFNSLFYNPWIMGLGPSSVSLFFTLSGFLITYLLLVERQRTGSIDVSSFYMRRILRIWPLYYLILVWAFFLLPRIHLGDYDQQLPAHYYSKLLLFIFMLPNVALVLYSPVSGAAQAWSIGVEEQFYLIWPQVIKRLGSGLLAALVLIVIGKLLLLQGLSGIVGHGQELGLSDTFLHRVGLVTQCLAITQIENMSMGAIAAYLYFQGRIQRLSFLLSGAARIMTTALIFLLIRYRGFFLHTVVEAATFAILITQMVCSPEFWRSVESRTLWHLGNLSYSIYMFHVTPLLFVMYVLTKFPALASNALVLNILLYPLTFAFTLALSHLSFVYFELPFLRLKKNFTVVKSGGA